MPTTTGRATDFITFSRASNATVVASDGKIKWAGHNLLTHSEQFDNAAWTKSSATVTANSDTAPDGTTTADTIAASGANGTALQSYTAAGFALTFAVWLKRKTGTGTIEIAADNGTYTAVTITSSWALYTVTQTPASGSRNAGIRIVSSGDEVYAWGAHLYRSDLGGMVANPARGDSYYPTTSAAYYAPRLDYDPVTLGAKGLLVEQQSTNLCLRSEEFDNASWTKTNLTVSANSAVAPSGAMTADTLTATAGNATITQGVTTTAVAFTFSIYIKRKTGTGNIDITMDGTTWVTQTISSSTWTRCIVTQTGVAGTSNLGIRIVTSGDEVYAWGAQAE